MNIGPGVRWKIVNRSIMFAIFSVVFSSCTSRDLPLTDAECKSVTDKEAAHLAGRFDRFPEMKEKILSMANNRAAQCSSGKVFDREDYDCVMTANRDAQITQCLRDAAKKSH